MVRSSLIGWPLRALFVAVLLLLGSGASAHLTPNSEMRVAFGPDRVDADIVIPVGDYAVATGNPTTNDGSSLRLAARYLNQRIVLHAKDGRAWMMHIKRIEFAQISGPPDLHAVVEFMPPPAASARHFQLDWTAVTDKVPGHFALIVATGDFGSGMVGDHREILGAVRASTPRLNIDRGRPSMMQGFTGAFRLGMQHIAEGHDHLLFLIALLLPAPLIAVGGHWARIRPVKDSLVKLAKIVSAFTVGHSMTLIGAAVFGLKLPAQPVEIMIALSILISAIHAAKPIFPGREEWVASGFGLIHGLAFATVVTGYGLGMTEKGLAILGFNLGIEFVQMLVVFAVMPSLLLLVRSNHYRPFRLVGAGVAAVAATAWVVERVAGTGNPVAMVMDSMFAQAPWLVAALTVIACFTYFRRSNKLAASNV